MLDNIGWGEILLILLAGLFILGPERLPSAAAWLGRAVRQVRQYASGARDQLRSELGPEFDQIRQPLEDLRGIRDLNPRRAVRRSLFDGFDDRPLDSGTNGGRPTPDIGPAKPQPLRPGERAPFDDDAT